MKLAVSNIAWRPGDASLAYETLAELGVRGLEIAPALLFPNEEDPMTPSFGAIESISAAAYRYNLALISMQSIHFGASDAKLFGVDHQRALFENVLQRAATLAGRLGIENLVMGSPRNRNIPMGMPSETAERIACDVFRRVGDVCAIAGTRLALEPNAPAYGTNFLNTLAETVKFTQLVNHPAVGVNFDMGNLEMNGEIDQAAGTFSDCARLISHVHISAPELAAPRPARILSMLAYAAREKGYANWFSLEMRSSGPFATSGVRETLMHCQQWLSAELDTSGNVS